MHDQDHAVRQTALWIRVAAALTLVGGLAACADVDPATDVFEWSRAVRQGVGRIIRDDPGPTERVIAPPPPDEGRPYPNLASVPPKPPRVLARVRDAEIDALGRDRDTAAGRAQGLETQGAGEGQALGTIVADSAGAFSADDEGVLRRAAELAGTPGRRIRLHGEAQAALLAADRLGRLGIGRERIDLIPAPQSAGAGRAVEIVVASGPPRR